MNKKLQIIIMILMIPFVIYFLPTSLGGDTTIMMVQGQSMLPTILPGSLVVAKVAPEYHIGDIVAYEQREDYASKIIVHRIIDVTNEGFVIKGDNNPNKDVGYPKEDAILGTVMFATPYVGDALGLFRNPFVLVISSVAILGIQMEQKRRKERKEKIRCLRLGIPYIPPKLRTPVKKDKKPDYSMFFAAIFINIVVFILTQISIENKITPAGDLLTGFMYRAIVPGLASTLIFAFYFVIIFGLYYLAKSYERKTSTKSSISYVSANSYQKLSHRKKSNPMLAVASAGWFLFISMSLFNVISLASSITPQVN